MSDSGTPVLCEYCKSETRYMKEVNGNDDIQYYFFCSCKKTPRYGSLHTAERNWEVHWYKIKPEDMPEFKVAESDRRQGFTGGIGR